MTPSTSSTASSTSTSARFVSFAESQNVVIDIESRSSYTDDEKQQLWFSKRELAKLQKKDNRLLCRVARDETMHATMAKARATGASESSTSDPAGNGPLPTNTASTITTIAAADDCLRGLESRSPAAALQRKVVMVQVIQTVLDVQRQQWISGIHDDVSVARASRDLSRSCRRQARNRAKADEAGIPEVVAMNKAKKRRAMEKKLKAQAAKSAAEAAALQKQSAKPLTSAFTSSKIRKMLSKALRRQRIFTQHAVDRS